MTQRERKVELGSAYPPRAMRIEQAATYLSISRASFLRLVEDGFMPAPIRIRGMVVWDRYDLDDAFEEMKRASIAPKPRNTMDELLGVITDGEEEG